MTLLNSLFVVGLVSYAANKNTQSLDANLNTTTSSNLDTQTILSRSPDPVISPSIAPVAKKVAATKKPSATTSPTATKSPTTTTSAPTSTPTVAATPKPTVAATPTPTPAASGCIVTINGASYNITSLVKSHSGGNVFKCGTDMSSTFSGASPRHNISWMTKYKI